MPFVLNAAPAQIGQGENVVNLTWSGELPDGTPVANAYPAGTVLTLESDPDTTYGWDTHGNLPSGGGYVQRDAFQDGQSVKFWGRWQGSQFDPLATFVWPGNAAPPALVMVASWSNVVTALAGEPPQLPSVTNLTILTGVASWTLAWDNVANASVYKVQYRATNGGAWTDLADVPAQHTARETYVQDFAGDNRFPELDSFDFRVAAYAPQGA